MSYFQGSPLSPNTIKVYEPRIRKWRDLVPGKSLEYIILLPRQAIRILSLHLKQRELAEKKAVCTMTNLRNYIAPILAVLRHSPQMVSIPDQQEYLQVWSKIMDDVNRPISERRNQQIPTAIQSQKGGSHLSFDDLVKRRDQGDLEMYPHLLLSMYTYIYPVRADYYATELIRGDDEPTSPNYIRITDDGLELVLRDFKTAKKYPPIHYPSLPEPLSSIILQSIEKQPRKYLFQKPNGLPYSRTTFSQWASHTLHQIFGVEMTLTLIRHHFVSTLEMDVPVAQLEKIGQLMGHSVPMQRLYKWHPEQKEEMDSESELESDGEEKSS